MKSAITKVDYNLNDNWQACLTAGRLQVGKINKY
jgi:hypothetical protein